MPQQNNTCPAIAQFLTLPEIRHISRRYGSHWEALTRPAKWALLACLTVEAAAWAAEGWEGMANPHTDTQEMIFANVALSNEEMGDCRYILGELQEIDEADQAMVVTAIASTIAAGLFAVHDGSLIA